MSLEFILIKALLNNQEIYNKYISYIKDINFEIEIKTIIKVISSYYSNYQEHNYISQDEFLNYLNYLYPSLKDKEVYSEVIRKIYALDTSDSLMADVIKHLIEKEYVNKIVNQCLPVLSGEHKGNVLTSLRETLAQAEEAISFQEKIASPFLEDNLDDLLCREVIEDGLNWRLACLQQDLGPLRGGTLGHVFARPDVGKTSFIISELSNFARQLQGVEKAIWFN